MVYTLCWCGVVVVFRCVLALKEQCANYHCVKGMHSSALINVTSEEIPCLSKEAMSPQAPQFPSLQQAGLAPCGSQLLFVLGLFLAANQEGNRSFLAK